MVFKNEIIKKYLEKKFGFIALKLYKVNGNLIESNEIEVNADFLISYFASVSQTPGYSRFNIKEMLNVRTIKYDDVLKFSRIKKLRKLK